MYSLFAVRRLAGPGRDITYEHSALLPLVSSSTLLPRKMMLAIVCRRAIFLYPKRAAWAYPALLS